MSGDPHTVDFFISRRGAAAHVAREAAEILEAAGYSVFIQDNDIDAGTNIIGAIHDGIERGRNFIALLTEDYASSPYTKIEWTSFFHLSERSKGARRLIVLRVEDVEPPGLLAPMVYDDLFGATDPAHRREIILSAAQGRRSAQYHAPKVFRGVPPRNPDFTGSLDLLEDLHRTLTEANQPAAITQAAAYGLGGIGKTSLATEYAYRHADDYGGVWWASAEDRTVLIGSLAKLASTLDFRLAAEKDAEQAARIGLAKLAEKQVPWLLVYDNVPNPEAIADLVPAGARLLITTRASGWQERAAEFRLDLMTPEAAAEFLLKLSGQEDRDGAAGLAKVLGYLPLALNLAGAYVKLTGITFDQYTSLYRELIGRTPNGIARQENVNGTFGLAVERAAAECPEVETLLGFFAMLDSERVPLDLLDEGILAEDACERARKALDAVSLVTYEAYPDGGQAVTVHRLVREAIRARLASTGWTEIALAAAIARLSSAFPDNGYGESKSWPRCGQLLPHVLALREMARENKVESVELAHLFDAAGNYLNGRSIYDLAEPLYREALAIGEKLLDFADPLLGQWLNNYANLLLDTGRYAEAEPLYTRAIMIGATTIGRNNPKVATRINNLAILLMKTGRYDRSEKYFREAVATTENAHGRTGPVVAQRLHNLATLLAQTRQWGEAETLYREAIALGEAALGRDNARVSGWLHSLANLLRDRGRFPEAEPLYREAIANLVAAAGIEHANVGTMKRDFAAMLLATGSFEEASKQASDALFVHEKRFGPDHPWTREAARIVADATAGLRHAKEAAQIRSRYGLDAPHAETA